MTFYITPPPQNPLIRVLTGIVGLAVLAGAFMIGMVALVVAAGLGLLVWSGVWLRMKWIRRQLRDRTGGDPENVRPTRGDNEAIETEYTVISRKREP